MKKISISLIVFGLIFLSSNPAFANLLDKSSVLKKQSEKKYDFSGKEPITVNGDLVEYFQERGEVVASKNVEILYQETKLTCDKIKVNINTKEAMAEGNVKLYQDGGVFYGDIISYDFATKKGTIISGGAKAEPWYGKAQKIEKVAETQYNLTRSYITTCDLDKPHYRLQAKRVKIFLGEKVVAYHMLVFIGNYPILYIPYYNHSLKDNMMHVSVTPGRTKEWGYFVLTRWRYYINDNAKGNILLDWREKLGFGEGVDYTYNAGKIGKGYTRFYYTREDDKNKDVDRVNDRYLIQYRHRMDTIKDTVVIGEYHKMSDASFLKDYFYREQYEVDDKPPTYVSIIMTKPSFTLSAYAQARVNKFFTEVERLPEVKLDIKETSIAKTNFYYKGDFSISNFSKKFADKDSSDEDALRIDVFNKASYVAKLFKFLNVIPYADARETFYSRNLFDEKNILRNVFDFGVDTNTRFFRVYDVKTNFLGLNINRLRHIITPSVGYKYTPPPTTAAENLFQFDEIDGLARGNTLTLSLENKLQTKRPTSISKVSKESKTATTNYQSADLVRTIIATDYLFKPKNESGSHFGDVTALLELRPYDWLFIKMDAAWSNQIIQNDEKISAFKSVNFDMSASHGDQWTLGVQNRYDRKVSTRFGAVGTYKLTPKWKVRALVNYDFKTDQFYDRELTLTRDLHCWEVDMTAAIKNKSEIIFYLIFRIKAFPETPLELQTTYSRTTPGSQDTLPRWWRSTY